MRRKDHHKRSFFRLAACAMVFLLGMGGATVSAATYQYTIDSGSYEIKTSVDGSQEIEMDGFGQLLDPGKPKLPSRIFNIAIPPDSSVSDVRIVAGDGQVLPGTYEIAPSPMESPLDATDADIARRQAHYDLIVSAAYASDDPYPADTGIFITRGGYRKYSLVQVRFTPFQYRANPKTLIYYPYAVVTIEYESGTPAYSEEEPEGAAAAEDAAETHPEVRIPEVEEQAAEILENDEDVRRWYPVPAEDISAEDAVGLYDFVIVTTEALVDAVEPLVIWEKSKGRTVYVATTTEIQAVYPTSDLQRAIRYWLRERYPADQWGITNVCLVGDLTDVPMRYTDPWKDGTLVPTDLYYAELSELDSLSWDDDWDGNFGEYGEDTIDFVQEVNVGRIPWSDFDTVEAICQKIAEYDYSSSMSGYKDNVLFNMAYFWYDTDGAVLSEYLLNSTTYFDDMTPYRIYERSIYNPGSTSHRWSVYTANDYMDSAGSPFVDRWASATNYGFVNWLGHGSSVSASYHCGDDLSCWNFIHRDDTTDLDDNYPAVVFSDSCSTAYPDVNSLGRNVMRQGGVAFVGASRTAYGAHGWNDPSDGNCESFHYEFARRVAGFANYTVGQCFRYALYTMYSTHNWGTSWYQMFEWTLFGNPDMRARAERPSLPNLDYYYRTGWDYPFVPRSAAGATTTWCPVTSTLPGNTADTYFNWTCENNGLIDSPPAYWRIHVDETWFGYNRPALAAGTSSYHINWNYGPTITGGRHTLYYVLDEDDEVWETSEYDNCWGRQFVWSPYALSDDTPIYREAGPHADAGACGFVYFNNDGFSFNVQSAYPNKYWSAVGVLPSNSAADYDLRLYDIGNYTGSEAGFGGGYLEYATWGGSGSEFVIVNDNTAAAGTYTAAAINRNNATGNYHIEEATSTKIFNGDNGTYSMSSTAVLDIYEYYISTAADYGFKLEQTSGTCDLGMSLYDDETEHASKTEYMTGGYANSNGDGADEFMRVTIPDAGYHGLVVWKVDDSDYNKTSTYTIKVGQCATPAALSGPSPADGAVNVSVNTDLDWADSADTEYYEVWLNDGGGWVKLGETETSAWTLPTLNDSTTYNWFIAANNICGTRIYVYWNFTTEDLSPPEPNPMTWDTEPYETSASVISMAATTATDITAPVEYYFQFYASPTGGTGGSNSGYIASTSYTDAGLSTNHQYGYRVYARDGLGHLTSPSIVSYDYTDIEASTGITFGTITAGSIRVRSTNTPSNLTSGSSGIYFRNDTAGLTSGWLQTNDWTSASLHPNTSYSFQALTRNGDGNATAYSPASARYTLANGPAAAAFDDVTHTSIRANWTVNGNPAGTEYYCSNITAGTGSGWTTSTSWTSAGLVPDTAYTFQVRARNAEGVVTAWTALGTQSTASYVEPCQGDFDDDGLVGALDLEAFATQFGRDDCTGASDCPGDFSPADLDVDGVDLATFAGEYGRTDCP